MFSGVPGRRCEVGKPAAVVPQFGEVEVPTPIGAHQPPTDGPLSQRPVEKPSSYTLRLEKAAA